MNNFHPVIFLQQLQQNFQWLIEQGGLVLWAIFFTCLLLWFLILERYWFIRVVLPKRLRLAKENKPAQEQPEWMTQGLQSSVMSEIKIQLKGPLSLIQTLIVLCPMLGLLGTVTGMVNVFDVIAVIGTSDAQAMAQGVYRATIPTMAGLVVSLSGLYFVSRIKHLIQIKTNTLAEQL